MAAPAGIGANIEAYEAIQDERERLGKYVVLHDRKLVNTFETADQAITHALETFGVAPNLIRRAGARRTIRLPSSLALRQTRADSLGSATRERRRAKRISPSPGTTIEVIVSALVDDGGSRVEETTHALVDTGAEESFIDFRLAQSLRMPVLDTVTVFWA